MAAESPESRGGTRILGMVRGCVRVDAFVASGDDGLGGCAGATDVGDGSCADHTTRVCAASCPRSQEVIVEVIRFIPQERVVADVTRASDTGEICGSRKNFHKSGFCIAEQIVVTSTTDHGKSGVDPAVHVHR